jgi:DNA-binding PadR family transcriptional regulator
MSLRAALLGLLAEKPATGYELVHEFDVANSVVWPAPQGELYRELARLEELGLAVPDAKRGARRQRKWHITSEGRAEFRRWMRAETDHTLRYEPMLKAVFLTTLGRYDLAAFLAREQAFFTSELRALAMPPDDEPPYRPERAHGRDMLIAFYKAMALWCREATKALDEEGGKGRRTSPEAGGRARAVRAPGRAR